jgi:hypothetical protein
MLIGFFVALTLFTAAGIYTAERIDRPRRRAERLAKQA